MTQTDTIAAIATPAGAGGIGVLRVSGPRVRAIARALIGKNPKPRIFHFGAFRDSDGGMLDRGFAVYFAAPRSYTGEDVLELHAHGSPVVLALLLKRVCAICGEACKRATVLDGGSPVTFVGDGISDRCAALGADRVFARDWLARWLDEQGAPYEPWADFDELIRTMAA